MPRTVTVAKRSPTPDPEFLAAVASDLVFLREEWDSTISDQSLRRSSTVLRNLLVEGAMGRAWRMAEKPKEPRVTAFDLATILSRVSRQKVAFASAGGAHSGGVQVAGALILSVALSDAEIEHMFEPMTRVPPGSPPEPPRTVFRLSSFVASPTMVVNGEEISRRELVKYVANKLGGAHYDDRRTERAHVLLDQALAKIGVADRRAPYFELLSIGQAVAAADDVSELLDAIAQTGAA